MLVILGLPLKLQYKLPVDKSKLVGRMHISYKINCYQAAQRQDVANSQCNSGNTSGNSGNTSKSRGNASTYVVFIYKANNPRKLGSTSAAVSMHFKCSTYIKSRDLVPWAPSIY